MTIIGGILAVGGGLVVLVYSIVLLVKAFQVSVVWGLGSLLVPLVQYIFIAVHWQVAREPFLRLLGGFAAMVVGLMIIPKQ